MTSKSLKLTLAFLSSHFHARLLVRTNLKYLRTKRAFGDEIKNIFKGNFIEANKTNFFRKWELEFKYNFQYTTTEFEIIVVVEVTVLYLLHCPLFSNERLVFINKGEGSK